jgi:hypothetical protein
LLSSVACNLGFSGGFVRRKLNRSQVEGISVDAGLWYIHHDFMAGQLDGSRVDLVVAPSRQLAGQLSNESDRVIWHLPAVKKGNFLRFDNPHVDRDAVAGLDDYRTIQLRGRGRWLDVEDMWSGFGAHNWRYLRARRLRCPLVRSALGSCCGSRTNCHPCGRRY